MASEPTTIPLNREGIDLRDLKNDLPEAEQVPQQQKQQGGMGGEIESEYVIPSPPPVTPAQTKLILQISAYKTSHRFGEWLKTDHASIFENLEYLTEQELRDRLNSLDIIISNKNTGKSIEAGVTLGLIGYENLTHNLLGLQTQGVTKALISDDTFLDTVEEIRLKNYCTTQIRPEYRLLQQVVTTSFAMHNMNLNSIKLHATPPADVEEEYDDVLN